MVSGPLAYHELGGQGAEDHVEKSAGGDYTRLPPNRGQCVTSFLQYNRNRIGWRLQPEERRPRAPVKLADTADCLWQKFRPRCNDRMGVRGRIAQGAPNLLFFGGPSVVR